MTGPLLEGLPPIADGNAHMLILGNMPSVMSLAAQQYYANPRNGFWRITGEIFGFDSAVGYDERTDALRVRGVAVWDVLRFCRRQGSLDSAIETDSMVANDFAPFFDAHPAIGSRVLQRRRGGEELRPPRRCRPAATLPPVAVDEPRPNHALRGQTERLAGSDSLGHRWAALRPGPRLFDLRTERQQCGFVEWSAHQLD